MCSGNPKFAKFINVNRHPDVVKAREAGKEEEAKAMAKSLMTQKDSKGRGVEEWAWEDRASWPKPISL